MIRRKATLRCCFLLHKKFWNIARLKWAWKSNSKAFSTQKQWLNLRGAPATAPILGIFLREVLFMSRSRKISSHISFPFGMEIKFIYFLYCRSAPAPNGSRLHKIWGEGKSSITHGESFLHTFSTFYFVLLSNYNILHKYFLHCKFMS